MKIVIGGEVVLIDKADAPLLERYTWHIVRPKNRRYGPYVAGRLKSDRRTRVYMHRLLLGLTGFVSKSDHVNGNTLDNRRKNLRACTHRQNLRNARLSVRNTTGFKGVSRVHGQPKFQASICCDYKLRYLGCFDTAKEAARAYNRAARELHGTFARLNPV